MKFGRTIRQPKAGKRLGFNKACSGATYLQKGRSFKHRPLVRATP